MNKIARGLKEAVVHAKNQRNEIPVAFLTFSYSARQFNDRLWSPIINVGGEEYQVAETYPTRAAALKDAAQRFNQMTALIHRLAEAGAYGTV